MDNRLSLDDLMFSGGDVELTFPTNTWVKTWLNKANRYSYIARMALLLVAMKVAVVGYIVLNKTVKFVVWLVK